MIIIMQTVERGRRSGNTRIMHKFILKMLVPSQCSALSVLDFTDLYFNYQVQRVQ